MTYLLITTGGPHGEETGLVALPKDADETSVVDTILWCRSKQGDMHPDAVVQPITDLGVSPSRAWYGRSVPAVDPRPQRGTDLRTWKDNAPVGGRGRES